MELKTGRCKVVEKERYGILVWGVRNALSARDDVLVDELVDELERRN